MNHVFARKAGNVRAGSANQLPLYHGCPMTCFSHRPRQVFAGFSTADDEHFIGFGVGHISVLSVRSSW
jgi:hypothetical protein